MKIKIAVLIGVLLAMLLVAINSVEAGDKCTGTVYKDHPGLVAECLHNQTVNHDPYPGIDETPYPSPGGTDDPYQDISPIIMPTPGFITPTSPAHDIGDHCYPFIPGGCN